MAPFRSKNSLVKAGGESPPFGNSRTFSDVAAIVIKLIPSPPDRELLMF